MNKTRVVSGRRSENSVPWNGSVGKDLKMLETRVKHDHPMELFNFNNYPFQENSGVTVPMVMSIPEKKPAQITGPRQSFDNDSLSSSSSSETTTDDSDSDENPEAGTGSENKIYTPGHFKNLGLWSMKTTWKRKREDSGTESECAEDEPLFVCQKCNFTSKYIPVIYVHKKRAHPENEGFRCSTCPFNCPQMHQMQRHLKTHQGVKYQYKCKLCRFESNSSWYMREIHEGVHTKKVDNQSKSLVVPKYPPRG